MSETDIPFVKMNGLGNDFVVVDGRARPFSVSPALASAIAHRTGGIGCDQLIVLEPSTRADVFMRIYNADGSGSGACGNATRCITLLVAPELSRADVRVETVAGVLDTAMNAAGLITVDMGAPSFFWRDIPLANEVADTGALGLAFTLPDGRVLGSPSAVSVGNPHCIFWVNDADSYDIGGFGRDLEHHPLFPERANVSLAEVQSPRRIKLSVWERGAGLTRACGTAACAAAAAAVRLGKTDRIVQVALLGGELSVEVRAGDGHVLMTGPATLDYRGTLYLDGEGAFTRFCRETRP